MIFTARGKCSAIAALSHDTRVPLLSQMLYGIQVSISFPIDILADVIVVLSFARSPLSFVSYFIFCFFN